MTYLPKPVGKKGVGVGAVTDGVTVIVRLGDGAGVLGVVGDTVSAVVGAGGVERVLTVDTVGVDGHVGSAISARANT